GGVASPYEEELIIRDMDLDLVTQVRQTWQFYRDRRPDAYADLVRP
ncbi:MAG TPA: acyltransferase, partial [Patescibacteria group bacterium]|nr:acyltransferase [Patescibacteria group bacterium]